MLLQLWSDLKTVSAMALVQNGILNSNICESQISWVVNGGNPKTLQNTADISIHHDFGSQTIYIILYAYRISGGPSVDGKYLMNDMNAN